VRLRTNDAGGSRALCADYSLASSTVTPVNRRHGAGQVGRFVAERELRKGVGYGAEWFQKSADQGYAEAQFALGLMHEAGIGGISKDIDNAKGLYHKAANQEHVLAKRQLCELSDDCTPAPIPTVNSTDEMSPWILLCFTPWTIALCAAMGG